MNDLTPAQAGEVEQVAAMLFDANSESRWCDLSLALRSIFIQDLHKFFGQGYHLVHHNDLLARRDEMAAMTAREKALKSAIGVIWQIVTISDGNRGDLGRIQALCMEALGPMGDAPVETGENS